MKKLILSLTLCGFAVAAVAGDACCPSSKQTTSSSCPAQKPVQTTKANACPAVKEQQTTSNKSDAKAQKAVAKQQSPKAKDLASK